MTSRLRATAFPVALLFLAATAGPLAAQFDEQELARRPQRETFLAEAEIVASEQMGKEQGVTQPYLLTLRLGDVQRQALWKNPEGRQGGFWEGWTYEIAAYRIDKLLGVNCVPPTVERRFNKSRGSLQLWIDTRMDVKKKEEEGIKVPGASLAHWNRMTYLQRAFDNLIANEDRHQKNLLITEDWKLLLIDHSRSFRTSKRFTRKLQFGDEQPMKQLPRSFVAKLRELDKATLNEAVGDFLRDGEIEAVMARRQLILDVIDRDIAARGEQAVLWHD
jgi:hypothetical protein